MFGLPVGMNSTSSMAAFSSERLASWSTLTAKTRSTDLTKICISANDFPGCSKKGEPFWADSREKKGSNGVHSNRSNCVRMNDVSMIIESSKFKAEYFCRREKIWATDFMKWNLVWTSISNFPPKGLQQSYQHHEQMGGKSIAIPKVNSKKSRLAIAIPKVNSKKHPASANIGYEVNETIVFHVGFIQVPFLTSFLVLHTAIVPISTDLIMSYN